MIVLPKSSRRIKKAHGAASDTRTQACPATEALRNSPLAGLFHVRCELTDGMVVLHGKVTTYYLKQQAQEIVKRVDVVNIVVNRLVVCRS